MDTKHDEKASQGAGSVEEELGVSKFEAEPLERAANATLEQRLAGAPTELGGTDEIGGLMPPEHVRQGLNQRHIQVRCLQEARGED